MKLCPCGSGKSYDVCCSLFISGQILPKTPEELMRSRYTAYTEVNIDYIIKTMKGPAAAGFDPVSAKQWASSVKWLRLEVLNSRLDSDTKGFVEFRAHYKDHGKKEVLHEVSEFHQEHGRWYYIKKL